MIVSCFNCGKTFQKANNQIKRSPNHFCSRSCAANVNNKIYKKQKNKNNKQNNLNNNHKNKKKEIKNNNLVIYSYSSFHKLDQFSFSLKENPSMFAQREKKE